MINLTDNSSLLNPHCREPASIAAAVAANCVPCIEYHFEAARNAGATAAEIKEAIAIGRMVKSRPTMELEATVRRLTDQFEKKPVAL